jgi:hypothetical protein
MARAGPSRSTEVAAEQAYCPACELKHVRAADWLCPRCGMPVETEAWRSTVGSRSIEPEAELEFPLGSVVAGAALAVTAVVLAVGFARNPVVQLRWPLVATMTVLLVLGLELLLKVSAARWVAGGVAVIALGVASEGLLRLLAPGLVRDPLAPAVRTMLMGAVGALYPLRITFAMALLGGTLLLLVGRPARWRIAAGALLGAPLAVGEIVRWFLS